MTIISRALTRAEAMYDLHETKFKESQLLRMEAISALNECGKALIEIRTALAGATKTKPVETDLGVFGSFSEFLNSNQTKFSARYAYQYIKLAEHWDIVLKLGMQDTTDEKTLQKSMRLNRTLRIIDWYKAKLDDGWDEELLTLDLYWQEDEQHKVTPSSRPSYKELQLEVNYLQSKVMDLQKHITTLEARLEPCPV